MLSTVHPSPRLRQKLKTRARERGQVLLAFHVTVGPRPDGSLPSQDEVDAELLRLSEQVDNGEFWEGHVFARHQSRPGRWLANSLAGQVVRNGWRLRRKPRLFLKQFRQHLAMLRRHAREERARQKHLKNVKFLKWQPAVPGEHHDQLL